MLTVKTGLEERSEMRAPRPESADADCRADTNVTRKPKLCNITNLEFTASDFSKRRSRETCRAVVSEAAVIPCRERKTMVTSWKRRQMVH